METITEAREAYIDAPVGLAQAEAVTFIVYLVMLENVRNVHKLVTLRQASKNRMFRHAAPYRNKPETLIQKTSLYAGAVLDITHFKQASGIK